MNQSRLASGRGGNADWLHRFLAVFYFCITEDSVEAAAAEAWMRQDFLMEAAGTQGRMLMAAVV